MAGFEDALNKSSEEEEVQDPEDQQEENDQESEDETEDGEQEPQDKKEEKEDQKVPLAAMMAERDKRKELEFQLKQAQAQAEQAKKQREEEEEIDPESDLSGYLQKREEKLIRSLSDKIYELSVINAKARYDDYDEKEKVFIEAANNDPSLVRKMGEAPDPAIFAYETAKSLELTAKYGNNPEEWRKAIAAEERKKLEAEMKGKKTNLEKAKAKQPSNLNDLRSAGGNDTAGYKPTSFGDVLKT